MLCVAKHSPVRIPSNRKLQTWKFTSKFLWKNATVKDKSELGRWTRDELVKLGPTFVKLGQIASTRGDLYPPEFTRELESLQDNVPPVAFDVVKDVVDLSLFEEFDEVPFKSASIGQVHKARLKKSKKPVIVKVKRPDIYTTMKTDTDNVREIVMFLDSIGIDTGNSSSVVLDQSIEYLLKETDYDLEVENAIDFKKSMKDVEWIKIPRVYKGLSTNDMIVMEYVPTQKLTEIDDSKVNPKKVCEALINAYIIQTMNNGLFHADPHPGNLGFSSRGKLVFYDFGLVIRLSPEFQDGFMEIFKYLITRDTAGIVSVLVRLGIIVPTTTDVTDIEVFFENILGYLENLDGGQIINDDLAGQLAMEKPFVVPTSFVYLAKAFSLIEGICIQLDPDFNYFTYLEPLVEEQFMEAFDIGEIVANTASIPGKVTKINTAVLGLERSRATMKRSMIRTQRELRTVQYSVACAVLAQTFNDTPLALVFILCTMWFTFRKSR
jgi:predicted unusual protein kinase regulating ubiquinone biosynthesis (AarF/ABC1/UbiB family)